MQERGVQLDGQIEIDEETRFSSVLRPNDDSGYDEIVDTLLDSRNDETFGDVSRSVISKTRTGANRGKTSDGSQVSLGSLLTVVLKLSSISIMSAFSIVVLSFPAQVVIAVLCYFVNLPSVF